MSSDPLGWQPHELQPHELQPHELQQREGQLREGQPYEGQPYEGQPHEPQEDEWQRLDPRTLAVRTGRLLGSTVTFLFFLVIIRRDSASAGLPMMMLLLIGVLLAALSELVRYLRTSFRITDERVELRTGLLSLRHLTIPRERIRRVELTAGLLHRGLGVVTLTVGTGEHGAGESDSLALDAVTRPVADALRTELLSHDVHGTAQDQLRPDQPTEGIGLAQFSWSWAPYDILSYWTLLLPLMALGGLYQLLSSAGVDPIDTDVVDSGSNLLRGTEWWIIALGIVGVGLAVGIIGSLASFIITWWGYELVREPGDRIRMQRGLFTTRSTTLDEHRLRGVEYRESLPVRAVDAGRLRVIAHGLSGDESVTADRADALLPPVPRSTAHGVEASVLRTDRPPTASVLRSHPAAARQRRLVRAGIFSAVVAIGLLVPVSAGAPVGLLALVVPISLVATLYALDTARSLGHAVDDRFLVTRHGSLSRRTAALQRSGIIGWTMTQSYFQRRRGLATLTATTAAGIGAYHVIDLDEHDAVAVAHEALPGLLSPLLDHDGPDEDRSGVSLVP